ncbi:MAG TPA: hypothetical protein V6C58_24790 [Allocoleopsis sp.]
MTGPIRNTIQERITDSFVESPTRTNKTAVEVFVGNAGDISGGGGSSNTTPSISNLNLTLANTEYIIALPSNCKGFVIKPRQICRLSIAYQSSGPYFDCGLGSGFIDNNKYLAQSIYVKSDKANTDIDLITYV